MKKILAWFENGLKFIVRSIRFKINGILNWYSYKRICKKADKISRLNRGMRVYIIPGKQGKASLGLITSVQLAEHNRRCAKNEKIDIPKLALYSYGWADKNQSAYETYVKNRKKQKHESQK
jgi:hypothetical protein